MSSLLTPYEFLLYSPVEMDYPTSQACMQIGFIEEAFFLECLTPKAYADMRADVINYAYSKYEIGATYAEGDVVLIHGCLKISLVDGNTENPYGETTNWAMAPKFEKACYNELWDRYLKFYLAIIAARKTIPYATFKAGGKGLTQYGSDNTGQHSVSKTDFEAYRQQLDADANTIKKLMLEYLDTILEDCFGIVRDNCSSGKCKPKSFSGTRIAFKPHTQR